jgi:ATP-dependent Clp protease ATP-binding subunit ClpC
VAKATTVRFTDAMFARLDQASAQTGMPINSIVVAACLEWMSRHIERSVPLVGVEEHAVPRWATIRRAIERASASRSTSSVYPFERFTTTAQKTLTVAQSEAQKAGHSYIGTEHLLLAAFADPSSHSAQTLAAIAVSEGSVRAMIDKVLRGEKKLAAVDRIIPTARVKKVIELAFRLCDTAGDTRVSTGHMLLALATEGHGIAANVLKDVGASREQIELTLDQLTEPEN